VILTAEIHMAHTKSNQLVLTDSQWNYWKCQNVFLTIAVSTYHWLGEYLSVFLKDSHHPPTEILAGACHKTLVHLTAAQPTGIYRNPPFNTIQYGQPSACSSSEVGDW